MYNCKTYGAWYSTNLQMKKATGKCCYICIACFISDWPEHNFAEHCEFLVFFCFFSKPIRLKKEPSLEHH
ncbi:hypothetical protein GDO86_000167 [Hymenochirus boettgeri]|uniref:Uncharacterized protein n=1 Tax=Hymenochirus boettgeri TaxID=247094 RepID=A0A8T2K7F2_9PIPI|nr:hypothetical protein GDO86_000167 [Hymenochirus boettgeri]